MKTLPTLMDLYLTRTNDRSDKNRAIGEEAIIDEIKLLANFANWYFMEDKVEKVLIAGNNEYQINNVQKIKSVFIKANGNKYPIKHITSRDKWEFIFSGNATGRPVYSFFDINTKKMELYPTPATAETLMVLFTKKVKDFTADYTAGTITWARYGQSVLVGNGTNWTESVVGRSIKLAGVWYKITLWTNATTITIDRAYEGNDIDTPTNYLIGDVIPLPDECAKLPVYRAIEEYFSSEKPNDAKATRYGNLYKEGVAVMAATYDSTDTSPGLDTLDEVPPNPNNYLRSI